MAMTAVTVNGKRYDVDLPEDTPLLWTLRDHLGLTGTKFGCGMALCGACTVHLDGQPVRSCTTPMSAVANKKITTIEAVGADRVGRAVQAAWIDMGVPQCGYCQAGQIMSATALLKRNPKPTDTEIDEAMGGNICRCGTYVRIRAAIKRAGAQQGAKA
jgi:isoquinoline 1-oxidoreductase alpha subunit